ncbi:MAG: hypothetical protein KGL53_05805, partial [Elusimicrobia bacterium]|nr:hypothetical protein [Elusimicrobiota bacterium]
MPAHSPAWEKGGMVSSWGRVRQLERTMSTGEKASASPALSMLAGEAASAAGNCTKKPSSFQGIDAPGQSRRSRAEAAQA